MNEQKAVELVSLRMQGLFDVHKILLFGSRARGEAKPDSDFDVLVIAETDVPFIERQGIGLRALGARDFAIDLLIYTPKEAEKASAIPGSALYWAEREGRVVYAK
jgi:uncharacterized protein